MTTPERDLSKLPKWAQDEITRLRRNVEWWKAKATAGPDNSNTYVSSGLDDYRPLGDCPSVDFHLDGQDAKSYQDRITVRVDRDNRRNPRIVISGGDAILIQPCGANAAYVHLEASYKGDAVRRQEEREQRQEGTP